MVTKLGPLCRVKLLNNPEKAGVGGSTPSLATIILKNLAESGLALPVRSQSAPVGRVAENRSQHCPCRSHAILADTVGITLQGQLNITVAKQGLYRLRICSNADQKRCQAVTQIMEAKSPWIIIYQSTFVVSVR